MRKLSKLLGLLVSFVLFMLIAGCGGNSDSQSPNFRKLVVGDSWTYQNIVVYRAGTAAPLTMTYEHKVTVVDKPVDATGKVYPYLAFKNEISQTAGAIVPQGFEYDLFTQDPTTRSVTLVGNITPAGVYIEKKGTMYLGSYTKGATHEFAFDAFGTDGIVNFAGTVIDNTIESALGKPLDCWVVYLEETSEPNAQNVHQNGTMTMKVYPQLGYYVELTSEFETPIPGGFSQVLMESKITSSNVAL